MFSPNAQVLFERGRNEARVEYVFYIVNGTLSLGAVTPGLWDPSDCPLRLPGASAP